MNLKKTLLSFMAAGAILSGGFAGVAAQDATTIGTVKVNDGGMFDVYFCGTSTGVSNGFDFDQANVSSSTGQTVTGDAVICYVDSKSYRDGFTTRLSASDFVGEEHQGVISNSKLSIGNVSIMNSGQWRGGDSAYANVGPITAFTATGGSIQSHGTHDYGMNDFGSSNMVHSAQGGAGTAGDRYKQTNIPGTSDLFPQDDRSDQGSWQDIQFEVEVPAGTRADDYQTTITIDITPGYRNDLP